PVFAKGLIEAGTIRRNNLRDRGRYSSVKACLGMLSPFQFFVPKMARAFGSPRVDISIRHERHHYLFVWQKGRIPPTAFNCLYESSVTRGRYTRIGRIKGHYAYQVIAAPSDRSLLATDH